MRAYGMRKWFVSWTRYDGTLKVLGFGWRHLLSAKPSEEVLSNLRDELNRRYPGEFIQFTSMNEV